MKNIMHIVEVKKIINTPEFNIGDRVWIYIDWIGYQKGTVVAMNNDSIVYDWLYDIRLDESQETDRKYTWNRCNLDMRKLKEF